jgi:hypothetical protein
VIDDREGDLADDNVFARCKSYPPTEPSCISEITFVYDISLNWIDRDAGNFTELSECLEQ